MSADKLGKRVVTDEDNPEWTEADFKRARPASEVLPSAFAAALVRGRGRPSKAPEERKRQVTLRLSPDVLKAARATGPGWQTRADEALRREFVGDDPAAARVPHKGRMVSMSELSRKGTIVVEKVAGSFKVGGTQAKRIIGLNRSTKSKGKKRA